MDFPAWCIGLTRFPPPNASLVPIYHLLKSLLQAYLRLPPESLSLVTIERVPEIMSRTIGDELYHSLRKDEWVSNFLDELGILPVSTKIQPRIFCAEP